MIMVMIMSYIDKNTEIFALQIGQDLHFRRLRVGQCRSDACFGQADPQGTRATGTSSGDPGVPSQTSRSITRSTSVAPLI
jgi:hypothetical protein